MAAACFFTTVSFLAQETGAEEKHPAPARYVTAYAADYNNNKTFCTADTVSVPVLPPPDDEDHVFSSLGALVSSRRFPRISILSCCSYSVVGAYRLIETGEGPLVSISVGFPGSVFPIQSRGDSVRRDRRIGSQPQGDGAGLSANPLPRGSHPLFL